MAEKVSRTSNLPDGREPRRSQVAAKAEAERSQGGGRAQLCSVEVAGSERSHAPSSALEHAQRQPDQRKAALAPTCINQLPAPYSRKKQNKDPNPEGSKGLLTPLDSDSVLNAAWARRAGTISHLHRSARVV